MPPITDAIRKRFAHETKECGTVAWSVESAELECLAKVAALTKDTPSDLSVEKLKPTLVILVELSLASPV